ncbi:MAG TPA: glycosyltransferase family 2 protein [Candidatus Saccharimonadales bacterium]|nr:glycosyltransferase family 2 protein [Candidatus Saccharimonadales bacterium]
MAAKLIRVKKPALTRFNIRKLRDGANSAQVNDLVNYINHRSAPSTVRLTGGGTSINKLASLSKLEPFVISVQRADDLKKIILKLKEAGCQNVNCGYLSNQNQGLIITGTQAYPPKIKTEKSVLAIVSLHNEADIIGHTVRHLLEEGVDVHVIDNWSNDNSHKIVQTLAKRNPGRVKIEMFPKKRVKNYDWTGILSRVEQIASESSYDWYIHHDSDEIRLSPWPGTSLRRAISYVDSLGYNAIDFTVLDFRPTQDGFGAKDDPEKFFKYFEFGSRSGHFVQVKGWKKQPSISLANSGGHEAAFEGRKIYPLKFVLKHYPLRSTNQASKKIFKERLPRILEEERQKGWHFQYDHFKKDHDFIWAKDGLIKFDDKFWSNYLLQRISGIGIKD